MAIPKFRAGEHLGLAVLLSLMASVNSPCQALVKNQSWPAVNLIARPVPLPQAEPFQISIPKEGWLDTSESRDQAVMGQENRGHGLIGRTVRRGLEDQKELYSAPFKVSNLKWDVPVLLITGGLIAGDKRIERGLPTVREKTYNLMSDVTLGTLSGGLVALWAYGIKTDNAHAKETGELELETLANTFLIYAPMQLIGARERPGEATNNGRFGHHHAVNTSFPAGHSMFTTAMATVIAHEYPKPWVQALAYGAAAAVTAGRLIGRDHWASDLFVGNVLGYLIARHIFHAHCDPELSEACGSK